MNAKKQQGALIIKDPALGTSGKLVYPHAHSWLKPRLPADVVDVDLINTLSPTNIDALKTRAFSTTIGDTNSYEKIKQGLGLLWKYELIDPSDTAVLNQGVKYVLGKTGKTYTNLDDLRSDSLLSYMTLGDFALAPNTILSAQAVNLKMNWN